jgi:hypothetical protein
MNLDVASTFKTVELIQKLQHGALNLDAHQLELTLQELLSTKKSRIMYNPAHEIGSR